MSRARLTICAAAALLALPVLAPGSAPAATVTVNSGLTDIVLTNSQCTLREAVLEANADLNTSADCAFIGGYGHDVITLNGTAALTVTGNDAAAMLGDLDVIDNDGLTITGTGGATITQNEANNDQRVFEAVDAPLTLIDLTVTGGSLDASAADCQGGNIRAEGTGTEDLTLTNVDVTGGQAVKPVATVQCVGGNVYAEDLDDIFVQSGSSVTGGNADSEAAGAGGGGGGIAITGTSGDLTVTDSGVSGNEAGFNSAATGGQHFGGGIFTFVAALNTVTLTDATIANNKAGGGTSTDIGVGGGMLLSATSALVATGGEISGNAAGGGSANASGGGGGIANISSLATLSLTDVDVLDNTAGANGGTGGGFGGGIFSQTPLVVTDSTIDGNQAGVPASALGNGGGIHMSYNAVPFPTLSVTGSTISDNHAAGSTALGGGINFAGDGNMTVTDSVVIGNDALGASPTSQASGGGIRAMDDAANTLDPTFSLTNTTMGGNTAGAGTAVGGGLYAQGDGTLTITGGAVEGNFANATDPAGSGAQGAGIWRGTGSEANDPTDSIEKTLIADNTATGTTQPGRGGGLFAGIDGTLLLRQNTFTGNGAVGNGATSGSGGAAELNSQAGGDMHTYTVENSTFSDNEARGTTAGGIGGGIRFGGIGTIPPLATISFSTVAENTAVGTGSGGAGGNLHDQLGAFFEQNVDLRAVIIANGTGDAGQENCAAPNANMFESLGFNVSTTNVTQCDLGHAKDKVLTDPLLMPLALNGGPVSILTHELSPGSPAIDAVSVAACPGSGIDQRGLGRPFDGDGDFNTECDAGAFEWRDSDVPAGPAPATQPPAATTPAKKKCRKGRKLKRGKCVKKKKKKK